MKKFIISKDEINRIIDTILLEEELKDNSGINIVAVNNYQFYKNYILNKTNVFTRLFSSDIIFPFIANGVNKSNGDIILLLDNIIGSNNRDFAIYKLVEVIYHEIRHTKQLYFDNYSYDAFFNKIDGYLRRYNNYLLIHDKYLFEIDADNYSIEKTELFLKKYYYDIYRKYEDDLNKRKKTNDNNKILYDSVYKLSTFIGLYKYNKCHFRELMNLYDISPVFEIFLNKDANFKSIKDIIGNDKFKLLDKRIIYSFFSMDCFLECVNFNDLSSSELEIINESLLYTKNQYKNLLIGIDEYFEIKNNDLKEYLVRQKKLIKRIDYISDFILKVILNRLYFVSNVMNKKMLIKKIDKIIIKQ